MLYLVLRKGPLEIVIFIFAESYIITFLLVSCKDFYFERDWNKLKVVIRCHMHFYKLFKLNCVLAVCVHNRPVMIKFHTVSIYNKIPFSQIELIADACLCDVTLTGPYHDCLIDSLVSAQTGLVFYLRPAQSQLSSVRHCFTAGADVDKNVS